MCAAAMVVFGSIAAAAPTQASGDEGSAVLNEIDTQGAYQYYSYDPEYALVEESEPAPRLTATVGER